MLTKFYDMVSLNNNELSTDKDFTKVKIVPTFSMDVFFYFLH